MESPDLAAHIDHKLHQKESSYENSDIDFFILPKDKKAFSSLVEEIGLCKHSLKIALFTWTHQDIVDAVIAAYKRGIDVEVILDAKTCLGASRFVAKKLKENHVPLYCNRGMQLMHHKLALCDNKVLISGSANWTKAAFKKNHELLFIIRKLDTKQLIFLKRMWDVLISESTLETDQIPQRLACDKISQIFLRRPSLGKLISTQT